MELELDRLRSLEHAALIALNIAAPCDTWHLRRSLKRVRGAVLDAEEALTKVLRGGWCERPGPEGCGSCDGCNEWGDEQYERSREN